jgi:hypothetical protein
MQDDYPVHYAVVAPGPFSRLQLLVRLVAFLALGTIGLSFGAVFAFGFLALPAYAAMRSAGGGERYAREDGPRVLAVIRWFAAVSAWTGLVAERLPTRVPEENILLTVDCTTQPTPGSALMRVITGIPSAVVLAVMCWLGVLVWLWAALTILVAERVGTGAFHYLVGLQRWSTRLLLYQASLVDAYPPFALSDPAARGLPAAHARP